ncbi:MAG: DUF2283 domain-containing protein, partial [Methanobrevibacter sp.]|nr:DUF2283 domain-containing protein [Candidatus Methanovirga basalitermitum]
MRSKKNILINADYDYKYDIFTITKKEKYDYKTSLELETGVILDIDENNNPVSLEILDASKVFNVRNKKNLVNFNDVNMSIKVTEQVISVEVKVSTMFHQKKEVNV